MVQTYSIADAFTNEETEKELLATIAANPEFYYQVIDIAPPEVWAIHGEMFKSMAAAIEQGKSVSVPAEWAPAEDPEAAAWELANLYQKRLMASLLEAVSDRLHHSDDPAAKLIAAMEDGVSTIHQAIRELRAGVTVALPDIFDEVLKQVAARYEATQGGGETAGIPTRFKTLDKLLGGLQKGLHLLAAEPGQGKTTFALQISRMAAAAGYPVLFVSFEESLDRLALKAICSAAGLPIKRYTDGYGRPEELRPAIAEHGPKMANLHLVEGTSRLTVGQLRAKALQLMSRAKKGKCLIIVDYLQQWAQRIDPETLVESETDRRTFRDFRFVVGRLAGQLRELAMRLESPMLIISSQNRAGQGTGNLASLKESGDLEYGADSVWFMRTPDDLQTEGTARAVDLVVAKNRYGDRGKVPLIFRPESGQFAEVAR